ncbi:hypothetical protein [Marinobacter sp. CA1]|uniref:hypothetical protein n=1 Tax=Marinobacter sp. CA1 TaxID=2817656 RepID=UPI001D08E363|nr:hypothetical protein [Marinobacter sp. CA1]UDL06110.1 hypothetical protein J2887_04950 [Marinobacter sp. CA1]
MKIASVAKTIAALSWSLMALVSMGVGWSLIAGNPSVSFSGDSVNDQFAIGYTVAGGFLLLQAAFTFCRKKLALVLSIPLALFAAIAGSGQLNQLFQGSIITSNYLIMYGFVFMVSILTIAVVAFSGNGADLENA